ncbi:16S rRNA (cytosine(967)-C(5))-methyltransferase RsmB [Paenibacillus nasutitermitis]
MHKTTEQKNAARSSAAATSGAIASGSTGSGKNNTHPKKGKPAQSSRLRTAREVALQTLVKVAEAGAYSNLQLNRALQDAQLSRQDAALATELVYGTISHQRTLDYRLEMLVTKGLDKLAVWVHQLLRMSAYQLLYLNRIPPHAAVNEAVQIAKHRGHAGISGMVNGVLRNMLRRLPEMQQPVSSEDPVKRIGLTYSYPDWLVGRWLSVYGEAGAEAICAAGNESPHASLRINSNRLSVEKGIALLAEAEIDATESKLTAGGIVIESNAGNLTQLEGYGEGLWTLQDESSMLVAQVCAPKPGMTVLDCCAAPGGKTTHMAELMNDMGRLVANDLHPHKKQLIQEQAQRLGLTIIEAVSGDASELSGQFPAEAFDVVLLDAPCSGFGVLRRKPEIKWTKSPEDIDAIAALQERLLDEASRLVKPGGTLVYSTCTIEQEENEGQINRFLQKHPAYLLDAAWPEPVLAPLLEAGLIGKDFQGALQLLPQHFGSDGFFIARFKRRD